MAFDNCGVAGTNTIHVTREDWTFLDDNVTDSKFCFYFIQLNAPASNISHKYSDHISCST
jgi:hypothetical protein